jgi:hypothetical protein
MKITAHFSFQVKEWNIYNDLSGEKQMLFPLYPIIFPNQIKPLSLFVNIYHFLLLKNAVV